MEEFRDPDGPIEEFSRGRFVILNEIHSELGEGFGKDIRLVGMVVSEWEERKGHILEKRMITGVFDQDIGVLIIGIGVDGMIEVPEETRQYIHDHGIGRLILKKTPKACRKYNELHREGLNVALLAHGTC
ncbi:MAG: hypothetical protein GX577_08700 [Leptolinea sp.]|nr:hypothetical protein [Leptolinea sp.]